LTDAAHAEIVDRQAKENFAHVFPQLKDAMLFTN
jgi:hypothetical protein